MNPSERPLEFMNFNNFLKYMDDLSNEEDNKNQKETLSPRNKP